MRRRFALAALALFLAACADDPDGTPLAPTSTDQRVSGAVFDARGQEVDFVPGRVLVRFAPGANAATVAAGAGGTVQRRLAVGTHVLTVPQGAEGRIVRALGNNPNVVYAEVDRIYTVGNPTVIPVNDPFMGYKWDLDNDGFIYRSDGTVEMSTGAADADMDWLEAYEALGGTVPGTARIGIMDTGIRHDHQDLQGRIAAEYDFFDNDPDAADDNGHGTHVAGIAAAATDNGTGVAGVAFAGTDFVIAKVCGPSKRGGPFGGYGCPSSAIADGIVFSVDNGAQVLNMSLGGGGGSTTTRDALIYARSNNVLPICAAGNDAGPVSYPGAWPECVAVSATDWSDGLASYSNFGPQVELSAPGGDDEDAQSGRSYILSSYFDSPTSYAFLAGTSMAAPQVAGLGALLHALGVTDDDAKLTLMKNTADDLGANGTDDLYGVGRINVFAAVSGVGGGGGGGGTANTPPTASFSDACSDLTCAFDGSASSDSDGSVVAYAWDFGDGSGGSGATPSHTYTGAGSYTVTLTVTDDDGATASSSRTVTVSEPPAPGGIVLSASGRKVQGRHVIDLTWSGAGSTQVDIVRDGSVVTTTPNDGSYTDATGNRGGATYVYQVCEAGTSTCSDTVTVVF